MASPSSFRDSLSALTARERDVLCLIAAGLSTAQIADRLHRSRRTIETHRHALGRKLGARNRVELAHIAIRAGLYGAPATDHEFDLAQYRTALVAGRAGCWEWDLTRNAIQFDQTMGELLGTEVAKPLAADEVLDQVQDGDRAALDQRITDHVNGRTSHLDIRYHFTRKDGTTLQLLSRGQVSHDVDGKPARISGVTMLLDQSP